MLARSSLRPADAIDGLSYRLAGSMGRKAFC